MRDGFLKVAACSPKIRVADVQGNVEACVGSIGSAAQAGAKVIVLPELCVCGSTCGDLLWQHTLLKAVEDGVNLIAAKTSHYDAIIVIGAPVAIRQKLYNCAVVMSHAKILGVVPKTNLSAAERRYFESGKDTQGVIHYAGSTAVPFGPKQVFLSPNSSNLRLAVQFGSDFFVPAMPAQEHVLAGATIIACPCATPSLVGSAQRLRKAAMAQSDRLECSFVMANAGEGESTTDYVFGGQCLVAEKGSLLSESVPFSVGEAISEVDVDLLAAERRRTLALWADPEPTDYVRTEAFLALENTELTRVVDAEPFIPSDTQARAARCEEILDIQAHALAQRMQAIGCKQAVVGISGGLDSTLALLVAARAFDILGLDHAGITAITMPGFGTTDRTHNNAWQLTEALGATPREIPIGAAVRQHFADIGHDESVRNAAYENAQARERTQILMDVANDNGGIVVGTGDLSELALGWATYNGDHMSMYAVNAAVPKTLIRHIVRHVANTCDNEREAEVLIDVLDTPVSPELLPANDDGSIAQQTEDLVGPYELHDFFAYHLLRHGFAPRKIMRLACVAFAGTYDAETILKWLKVFHRRFFSQQFKRSCCPDGPAVGNVGLSPRGGLVMPSDATSALWLAELNEL